MPYSTEDELEESLMADYRGPLTTASKFAPKGHYQRMLVWSSCISWSLVILLLVSAFFRPRVQAHCPSDLSYSPAQDAVEYEVKTFQLGFGSSKTPYQGPPSPELDKIWSDLYNVGIPSLIPLDMAAKLLNKTVIFPHDKERRYIITLDVFHQLHCLNMVRMALRPDHYMGHTALHDRGDKTAQTETETANADTELFGVDHIDHCIDSIRQSLTCNADTSALTWTWDDEEQRNLPRVSVSHTCKRFDKIQAWARAHGAADREFDETFRVLNDPLDPNTWTDGFTG